MDALLLTLAAGTVFVIAYFTYGRWLSRKVFRLRQDAVTPAQELCDDRDFCPTSRAVVFGHHFTSIAGTGPIVGPAIAVMWGWLPAILWVVIGSVFMGAVHDFASLVVSLRNQGRSVGDIAGDLLGPRVRLVFLVILVVALWVVLAIFGLVVAAVLKQYPGAITPVLVQVPLAVVIGMTVHRRGGRILIPSIIALLVMYASVVFGDWGPLHAFNQFLAAQPTIIWVLGLLIYAYIASVLPVWTLLQPRDYINALQLVTALGLLVVGLIVAAAIGGAPDDIPGLTPGVDGAERPALSIVAPVFNASPEGAPPMIPILFITIACGAISGFHCLVASGTTSKQLRDETDAQAVGYGSMLTEGFLATLVIVSCVAGLGLSSIQGNAASKPSIFSSHQGHDVHGESATITFEIPLAHGGYFVVVSDKKGRQNNPESFQEHGQWPLLGVFPGLSSYDDTELYSSVLDGNWDTFESSRIWVDPSFNGDFAVGGEIVFHDRYSSWSAAGSLGAKVGAFVDGAANLVKSIGIPASVSIALMGVLVASFAGTTMDTSCRLQRYVIQELARTFLPKQRDPGAMPSAVAVSVRLASKWNPFKWLATTHGATVFAVISALALAAIPAPGQAWSLAGAGAGGLILWPLFGATNQLLGGLAFCVIAAWLIATERPWWFVALPAALMLVLPAWAMGWQAFIGDANTPSWWANGDWLLVVVAAVILLLEAWLVTEVALRLFRGVRQQATT